MQVTMNRQDLQSTVDAAKNRIIERLVSKSEIQGACDNARDRIIAFSNTLHQQHQQFLRHSIGLSDQQLRRTVAVESRMVSMEQEMKSLKQILFALMEEQRQLNTALAALPGVLSAYSQSRQVAEPEPNEAATHLRPAYNAG